MPNSIKLKYLKKERGYWYFRKNIVRRRLAGNPGDPQFMSDYATALLEVPGLKTASRAPPEVLPDTFRALASKYFGSKEFTDLKPKTRKIYRNMGDLACDIFAYSNIDEIQMPDVLAVRDKFSATPGKANEFCKIVRIIYGWGIPRGKVKHNPADFRGTSVKKLKLGSHKPWPEDVLDDFLARATGPVRQVMMVCVFTGQRIGDVLKFMHSNRKGDTIEMVQEKTGKALRIPLHPELKDMLDDMDRNSTHILTTGRGTVWKYNNWSDTLNKEKARLGVPGDFTTHGLRKNAVNRLLLCGCTTQEAGSITGQTDETVSYYARGIDQARLAQKAMDRYANWTKDERDGNKKVVNFADNSPV